jgi:hypothetical protein
MAKARFLRHVLAAALALCVAASPARARQLTITPATPTSVDSVHVVWTNEFSMGLCWKVQSRTCTTAAPDSVLIIADIQYCNGAPGCFCTAQPTPYQVACDFPPLPPGTYRAVYRERNLNPADIRTNSPFEVLFTVGQPTPSLRRSWGRLKAIYR